MAERSNRLAALNPEYPRAARFARAAATTLVAGVPVDHDDGDAGYAPLLDGALLIDSIHLEI